MSREQGPHRKVGMQPAEIAVGRRQADHCARGNMLEGAT